MIPLLIGAGVIAAALIGGAILSGIFDSDEQKEAWNDKTIVILGTRAVGKSTFCHFLKTGEIITEYHATTSKEKIGRCTVEIDGVSLEIKIDNDVAGSVDSHRIWQSEIKKADYIFYMVDLYKVFKKDSEHLQSIKKDLSVIAELARETKIKKVFLIGNKADKTSRYPNDIEKLEKEFSKLPFIQETILKLGGTNHCEYIFGSLRNRVEAEKLVKNIFTRV